VDSSQVHHLNFANGRFSEDFENKTLKTKGICMHAAYISRDRVPYSGKQFHSQSYLFTGPSPQPNASHTTGLWDWWLTTCVPQHVPFMP
jgi:hypothetical protein